MSLCNSVYHSSFGHHSAKSYEITDGYKSKKTVDEKKRVKLGLAITRQSVLKVIYAASCFVVVCVRTIIFGLTDFLIHVLGV